MARPIGTTRAKKAIKKEEYEKLIRFVNHSNQLHQQRLRTKMRRLFVLLYATGCRVSEVCDFTFGDIKYMVDQKEYSLTNATKTKRSRLIVLSDKQVSIIKALVPDYPVSSETKLFDGSGSSYLTVKANDIIHKCLGELYSTHSFRAGYITRLAENGANPKLIQEDIGHSKVATTLGYIKVTDDMKRLAKEGLVW